MRLIDLTGQRRGSITVVQRHGTRSGNSVWLCRCDCGTERAFPSTSLKSDVISCGCRARDNWRRLRPYEALYRRMKRDNTGCLRTLPFTLTYDEFVSFTAHNQCFYCHSAIQWKDYSSGGYGYNLDRCDNDKGYHKENLVVCCKRCNMGKRDTFTFDEWFGMTAYFRTA